MKLELYINVFTIYTDFFSFLGAICVALYLVFKYTARHHVAAETNKQTNADETDKRENIFNTFQCLCLYLVLFLNVQKERMVRYLFLDIYHVIPFHSVSGAFSLFSYFAHRMRHDTSIQCAQEPFFGGGGEGQKWWWARRNLFIIVAVAMNKKKCRSSVSFRVPWSINLGVCVCVSVSHQSPVKTLKQNFHFIIFPLGCIIAAHATTARKKSA